MDSAEIENLYVLIERDSQGRASSCDVEGIRIFRNSFFRHLFARVTQDASGREYCRRVETALERHQWDVAWNTSVFYFGGRRAAWKVFSEREIGIAICRCLGVASSENLLILAREKPYMSGDSDEEQTSASKRIRSPTVSISSNEAISDTERETPPVLVKQTRIDQFTVDKSMPKTLQAFYHTVVYFSDERTTSNRVKERQALKQLANELTKYFASKRAYKYHALVCEHLWGSDNLLLNDLKREKLNLSGAGSVFQATEREFAEEWKHGHEPHIHVVYYQSTRNGTGAERIIEQWRRRYNTQSTSSSAKVGSYAHLREYLYQGRGRLLRFENIPGELGEENVHLQTDVHESDGSSGIFCISSRRGDKCEVEGKCSFYNYAQCCVSLYYDHL